MNLTGSGNSTVILAGMEVKELFSCQANCICTVFLFQVHMEGIKVKSNIVAPVYIDELQSLRNHIEHISFKAVKGFHRQFYIFRSRIICQLPNPFDGAIPLRLASFFILDMVFADR